MTTRLASGGELRRQSTAADSADPHVDQGALSSANQKGPDTSGEFRVTVPVDELPNRFGDAADALYAGRKAEAIAKSRDLIFLFHRAVEQSPDDPDLRYQLALALLLAGDREGYRRVCAATLEHFGRSQDPLVGAAARACLVAPGAVLDPLVPLRLAERANAQEPSVPWRIYVLGLAEYRAGRYNGAVERLEESLTLGTTWASAPLNYPVLAMAHHRLGHGDESRRWLEKAARPAR